MSDFVRNINGVDFADAGDTEVYIGVPESDDLIASGLAGDFEAMADGAQRTVSVKALIDIATKAQAVLDTQGDTGAMAQLAQVFEDAGLVGDGFYTDLYGGGR